MVDTSYGTEVGPEYQFWAFMSEAAEKYLALIVKWREIDFPDEVDRELDYWWHLIPPDELWEVRDRIAKIK